MQRSTLEYYRMFAGWGNGVGSVQGALNDFQTLPCDRRQAFLLILNGAVGRDSLSDPEVAARFVAHDC